MTTKLHKLLLYLILLLAFILRFWQFDLRYGIGYDGSRDAIVSFESARQLQLPLTGSFSSIGPITFGPWYYYYITFANFVIPSIWAPWIAIGLASFAMVFAMYKIGSLLININFGLLLALIAAISPAQVSASTSLQQHALIGLLSSLILYLFIKISHKDTSDGVRTHSSEVEESRKLSVTWGFLSGMAINIHFQATGLLTLPFLLFLFVKKKRFILYFIVGFFISMIPILIFELNNHWFNTRNIIDYVMIGQYRVWTSNRWLTFLGKFWPEFWSYVTGIPMIASMVLVYACGLILLAKFLKKKLSSPLILLSISFIIQLIFLRYYRGEKFFGYLQFFHPFLFIYTGYILYSIMRRVNNLLFSAFFTLLYLFLVIPNSFSYLKPDEFNLETRKRLNFLVSKYPQAKFSTFECKNMYERHRIQGLLLFLYMNKLYDEKGEKITIYNPSCTYGENEKLDLDLVNITNLTSDDLKKANLSKISPLDVYNETTRWWFKEQP